MKFKKHVILLFYTRNESLINRFFLLVLFVSILVSHSFFYFNRSMCITCRRRRAYAAGNNYSAVNI